MSPDIRRPGDIDAAWLTAVLQGAGVDAVVSGFTAAGVGTGQIGDSVRFRLDYARVAPGAPASLVGKFPAANDDSRNTGVMLGNYLREVRFYQHLAGKALVQTPRVWFTDVEEATGEFALIMEDLSPAVQGDQLKGVTLDQARLVMVQAARLHASFWADDSLDALPWVSGSKAAPAGPVSGELVGGLWQGFCARYGDRMPADAIAVGEAISDRWGALGSLYDGPRCLTHNDFRPDNMMFGTSAGGHPLTVLDWQSFAYGAGSMDVAYFLAGALTPDERRAAEPELLGLYHRTLTDLGVNGYPLADLRQHYRFGAFQLFLTAFFAAMVVEQTPRGDEMFLQMIGGATTHIHDHGALALLG